MTVADDNPSDVTVQSFRDPAPDGRRDCVRPKRSGHVWWRKVWSGLALLLPLRGRAGFVAGPQKGIANRMARRRQRLLNVLFEEPGGTGTHWGWETDENGRLTWTSRGLRFVAPGPEPSRRDLTFSQLGEQFGWHADWSALEAATSLSCSFGPIILSVETPYGMFWWRFSGRPKLDAFGRFKGHTGIAWDETGWHGECRHLLASVREARTESSNRLNFLATFCQQVRTDLNTISGFSELLLSQHHGPLGCAAYEDYARSVKDAGHSMSRLIGDAADLTRFAAGNLCLVEEMVDLGELLEIAVKTGQGQAAHHGVCLVGPARLPEIFVIADLKRMQQLLDRLFCGAIASAMSGSTIVVEFSKLPEEEIEITVRLGDVSGESYTACEIADPLRQEGADPDCIQSQVLSLAVARELARLHGGELSAHSEIGRPPQLRLIFPGHRLVDRTADLPDQMQA